MNACAARVLVRPFHLNSPMQDLAQRRAYEQEQRRKQRTVVTSTLW